MPTSTKKFGYSIYDKDYLIKANALNGNVIDAMVSEADVAIFGACSTKYLYKRLDCNKLSFIFSERVWKKGYYSAINPKNIWRMYRKYRKNKTKNMYVLCASGFLAYDLKIIGFPVSKCFTWGYFPPFDVLDTSMVLSKKNDTIRILYAGRFIKLKHVEDLLYASHKLKQCGVSFEVVLLGDGEEREHYCDLIDKLEIKDFVQVKSSVPQAQVREEMKKAHLFFFGSDYNEGWGAVINEAMNSLCVPIVSHSAGCSSVLIKQGFNGYVYHLGDIDELANRMQSLFENRSKLEQLATNAYNTIASCFNAKVAAERFLSIANDLLYGNPLHHYIDGPMSMAPEIKNSWYGKNK